MLNANRWDRQVLEDVSVPDNWTEGVGSLTITAGYYDDPATGESYLIESTRILRAFTGRLLRKDVERYVYEIAGSPPLEYHRETWGAVYLPKIHNSGDEGTVLLEEETTRYYPWTGFTAGPNLSRRRELSGYVIYDLAPGARSLTQEQIDRLEMRGYTTGNESIQQILDSARMWSDAIRGSEVIDETAVPQRALWVSPVETEWDIVFNEPDKWTTYTYRKSHLHPGDSSVDGPYHQRKESWQYRLPVPIDAPSIKARAAGDAGITLEVTGGGATITSTIGEPTRIPPEQYRIERRVVSEPEREAAADPWDMYDSDPAAGPERSTLWTDVEVLDYSGFSTDPLPPAEEYEDEEPGDPSDVEVEGWTLIAEVKNAGEWGEDGHAETSDTDVVGQGIYEYRAIAVIGQDQSPPGPVDRVTATAAPTRSGFLARTRRAADGAIEVDVLTPEDPGLLEADYGEALVFDLYADPYDYVDFTTDDPYGDLEDLAVEWATRLAARDQAPQMTATVNLGVPLIALERGQEVIAGTMTWHTTGNEMVIESESTGDVWILDGFTLGASRSGTGAVEGLTTTLYLVEP